MQAENQLFASKSQVSPSGAGGNAGSSRWFRFRFPMMCSWLCSWLCSIISRKLLYNEVSLNIRHLLRNNGWTKDPNLPEAQVMDPEIADDIMNTIALVNSLTLAIPLTVVCSVEAESWEWLTKLHDTCYGYYDTDEAGNSTYDGHTSYWFVTPPFAKVPAKIFSFHSATIYVVSTCAIAIQIVMFYYILKPRDNERFQKWWRHVFFTVVLCTVGTIYNIIVMWNLLKLCLNVSIITERTDCAQFDLVYNASFWGAIAGFVFPIAALVTYL
jgi:hypothetical protein